MSEIKVATVEEIKTEEQAPVFVPTNTLAVMIDPLSKEAFDRWYTGWIINQGAKALKLAQVEQEKAEKLDAIDKLLADSIARIEAAQKKAASKSDWAGIAKLQTEREQAEARAQKERDKLNKVTTPKGDGELTADKLSASEIRNSVHYFSVGGKAFVVAHSSIVKTAITDKVKVTGDSNGYVAFECQPVTTKKVDARRYTESVPTIEGKPFGIVVEPGQRQSVLSHSGFTNGVVKVLRETGRVSVSASTAYQPFSCDSVVTDHKYEFVVVKE